MYGNLEIESGFEQERLELLLKTIFQESDIC